jgi:hypothetical protein
LFLITFSKLQTAATLKINSVGTTNSDSETTDKLNEQPSTVRQSVKRKNQLPVKNEKLAKKMKKIHVESIKLE